ncbi:hypothetical protein Peur_002653 [Populus x canadensis]
MSFSHQMLMIKGSKTRNGLNLLELVVAMSTSGSNMQSWMVACVADTPATSTVSDPLDQVVHFSLFMFVPFSFASLLFTATICCYRGGMVLLYAMVARSVEMMVSVDGGWSATGLEAQ